MAKDGNTFAKRQRETQKKRKALEKRERRQKRKDQPDSPVVVSVPDDSVPDDRPAGEP